MILNAEAIVNKSGAGGFSCLSDAPYYDKIMHMMNDFEKRYIEARRNVVRAEFDHLNPMQQEAVLATEGPLLVLAGAGSGKTTVLINRIANILKYGRASDSEELPFDADEKQLEINTDIDDSIAVTTDREMLTLVWNNLISNAIKFTEAGGKIIDPWNLLFASR